MSDFLLSVPGRLTTLINNVGTLLTRWTQTKADYVDAAISTRAPGATALDKNIWTDARAARLDNIDYLYAAAANNVANPILNPISSLNNITSIAGLLSITVPYGITTSTPVTVVSAGVYYDVINITGKGVINYLDVSIFSGASGFGGFRLTLDGVVMTLTNISGTNAGNLIIGVITSAGIVALEEVPFRSQFKLEVTSVGAGAALKARYRYRRTG